MAKSNPRLSLEKANHLALHGSRWTTDGYQWKFDPRVGMFAPEDLPDSESFYWREITALALILSGGKSWKSNPASDGRARHFHDCTTMSFEDSGHWLHHDQPDTSSRSYGNSSSRAAWRGNGPKAKRRRRYGGAAGFSTAKCLTDDQKL